MSEAVEYGPGGVHADGPTAEPERGDSCLPALEHCDDALGFVEDVRHELRKAQDALPIYADNLRVFLGKTTDALAVVETRLHTASNHIRRAA